MDLPNDGLWSPATVSACNFENLQSASTCNCVAFPQYESQALQARESDVKALVALIMLTRELVRYTRSAPLHSVSKSGRISTKTAGEVSNCSTLSEYARESFRSLLGRPCPKREAQRFHKN